MVHTYNGASLVAQTAKRLPTMRETQFDSWVGKIPWRRKWQSTPALLPGKSHGPRSLIGYSPATAKSLQSCPTLCNPIDGSPRGYPVPGILQARVLEWGAIAFSEATVHGVTKSWT